jgi:hypothetical protein
MNFEIQKPNHLISLSSSAQLVTVEVNVWTATKQDKQISNEVTSAKNASTDAGKFTKNLLSNSPDHKALLNYRQTVYNWLQRCTFDWAGSVRLLPTFSIEKFMKEWASHEVEFNKLLDNFISKYPTIVSDAAFKQGDMFNRSEYPEPEDIRRRFRLKLFVTKVPENDFRSGGIATAIADDLEQHYNNQIEEIVNKSMEEASERLIEIASRISNACTEVTPDDDGKVKRKKVYETTISQARDICETLKHFNLTNNQQLESARAQLEEALSGVTLEDLRESSYVRSTVKDSVDDMLNKFKPLSFN